VLLAPRNYEHLPCLQVNASIPEVDADLPVENDEHLVCLGVTVPDKITLNLYQLKSENLASFSPKLMAT
jgi:hypothetical protein